MRIRISEPDLAGDLLSFLQRRVDVIGAQVSDDELEISLLGSRRDPFNRIELDERLQAWQREHPDIDVEIETE